MKASNKKFWNREYKHPAHLKISLEPSEDLKKFSRFLLRLEGKKTLNQTARVLDLGSGNGRNLIYLAKEFSVSGIGYDISDEAVSQATKTARKLPVSFECRKLEEELPIEDSKIDIVLDMMSSHVLDDSHRKKMLHEVVRVLKPGGWLLFKSFLLTNDYNAKRMLKKYPAGEVNSYLHPKLGSYEHVWTEQEVKDFFGPHFLIKKIERSHKHFVRGRPFKRRQIVAYMQKG